MQIVVTGGTGFIGKRLVALLRDSGHQPIVLSRNRERAKSAFTGSEVTSFLPRPQGEASAGLRFLEWSPGEPWQQVVADADAVFHLAGASVAGQRWTADYKREIRMSRVETTRAIVEAGPKVLVSASGVGFYGDGGDTLLTESSPVGKDFLAEVCLHWEQEARLAADAGARVALVRIGIVLGAGGGSLAAMLNPPVVPFSPWKMGLGGALGSGKQWMPWVHLDDVVRLFLWCAENANAQGPYNAVAPNPVTNTDFSAALGRVLNRPSLVAVPAFALKTLLGEFADYLLYSQRVLPQRATEQGFAFRFTGVEAALRDVLAPAKP